MIVRELLTTWGFNIDNASLKRLDTQLGVTRKKADKFGKNLGELAKRAQGFSIAFTAATTLPIALFGFSALRAAGQFEKGMNRVRALTDATSDDFSLLTKQAKELGRTTQFTATQTADAMGFLAQAGLDATEIFAAIPGTLRLAGAAQLDFATTADIVTNVMKGMGIEADDLDDTVDILTKTFVSSNTDLSQLGQAMKFAGPVARGFGLTIAETTAILGRMGDAGIQASLAGTSLRGALTRLSDPGKEARDILGSLGVKTQDSAGDIRNFIDILSDLEKAGINTTQVMQVFGLRAGPAISVLLNEGIEEIRKFESVLKSAGGTADRIQKQQLKGLIGQLTKLKSAWEGFLIAFAESGFTQILTTVLRKFTSWIASLAKLSPTILRFTGIVLGLIAILGPLLFIVATATLALKALGVAALFAGKGMLFLPVVIITIIALLALLIDDLIAFSNGQKSVIGDLTEGWGLFGKTFNEIGGELFKFMTEAERVTKGYGSSLANLVSTVKEFLRIASGGPILKAFNDFGTFLGTGAANIINDGNVGFGTNSSLATSSNNSIQGNVGRQISISSNITVGVPVGTPEEQKAIVKESARAAVQEEWRNILDITSSEATETE